MRVPKRTAYAMAIAISIVILLVLMVYLLAFSMVKVSGVVDHKTITGIRDQTLYSLVVMYPWGIQIDDHALDYLFQGKDQNVTINATFEQAILSHGYSKINYLASIQVSSKDSVNHLNPGDALAYFVKRSDFNALRIGNTVTYEVEKGKTLTIARVND